MHLTWFGHFNEIIPKEKHEARSAVQFTPPIFVCKYLFCHLNFIPQYCTSLHCEHLSGDTFNHRCDL